MQYNIIKRIGKGGMSTVYLAEDREYKKWAIKAVKKSVLNTDKYAYESLLKEIELLKKLDNPHLPKIKEILEGKDYLYMVKEYTEGNTLEDLMKEKSTFSMDEVINIAKQIGEVLEYLHSQRPSIIYRDLKPTNIMQKEDGTIVLIDFGAAREYRRNRIEDTVCLGTRGYAAPEQFGGEGQSDARTDIYALGVTMYYLLTGKNPGKPPYEIYPIRYWDEGFSKDIERVIIKSTKMNPEERYQKVEDFLYDLEGCQRKDNPLSRKHIGKIFQNIHLLRYRNENRTVLLNNIK